MKKLMSIGEALIDFMPSQKGIALKEVSEFTKAPGGAPANVAAVVAKLGGRSAMLTKLGEDAFGTFLIDTLAKAGVDVSYIYRTKKANTGLAFVSLQANGERDFSFYRNPSADLLLEADEVEATFLENGDIVHFCSVDLIESPMKYAHHKLLDIADTKNCIISFDPNVRLPLWENPEACRNAIHEFLPRATIVKISDEELEFITGIQDENTALKSLFIGNVKCIIYTLGKDGARICTQDHDLFVPGFSVEAIDTTGAGDSFIGSFLYQLLYAGATRENFLAVLGTEEHMMDMLRFSNGVGALLTTQKGAIDAIPTLMTIHTFLREKETK